MKHLRHFKVNENLSDDKIEKIKSLYRHGYYTNVSDNTLVKKEFKNIDLFYEVKNKVFNIFKGFKFYIQENNLEYIIFKISNELITITILEMFDEYFYVLLLEKNKQEAEYIVFLADQIDGLVYLLTDIHKIIKN